MTTTKTPTAAARRPRRLRLSKATSQSLTSRFTSLTSLLLLSTHSFSFAHSSLFLLARYAASAFCFLLFLFRTSPAFQRLLDLQSRLASDNNCARRWRCRSLNRASELRAIRVAARVAI